MSVGELHQGHCKWFNSKKGYGFISTDDGLDLFVHQSEIRAGGFRNLAEGEKVEFMIETLDDGRKKAVNVTGPGGSQVQGERRRPRHPDEVFGGRGRGMPGSQGSGIQNGGADWNMRERRDYQNWRR